MDSFAGVAHEALDIFVIANLDALPVIVVFFVALQPVLNGLRVFRSIHFRGHGFAHIVVQLAHKLDIGISRKILAFYLGCGAQAQQGRQGEGKPQKMIGHACAPSPEGSSTKPPSRMVSTLSATWK